MKSIVFAIKKDVKEYMRGKKNIYFSLTLLAIGAMVLLTTMFFPNLIAALAEKAPDMISDSGSLDAMMANLFPDDLKGSFGIWASDVGVFYSIVTVLMTHGLISNEIKTGKWIMPVASGYKKSELLLSKCIVYGGGAAFPVLVVSNLYYFVASAVLDNNIGFSVAFLNSLILSIAIAAITVFTILSSVLYKHSITAGLSIIVIVMVAPDVLTYFSFGKFMPTYLLTYVYSMSVNTIDLVVPLIEIIAIFAALFVFANHKVTTMEITR